MSMGELLQVDRPQRLYDVPDNLFVASFIGTPPMNLFRSSIRMEEGRVLVQLAGVELPVGSACVTRYGAIRAMAEREVVVGMRAEDLHPASERPDLPTIDATVELVEALGSGVMAYLSIDADPVRPPGSRAEDGNGAGEGLAAPNLVADFPPRVDLTIAEKIPVAIDTESLHFFDEETGAALR
jgi:multiple sugar transport system ATP-binding protein